MTIYPYHYKLGGIYSLYKFARQYRKSTDVDKFGELVFPIEAYREFCKQCKLKFPFDDGADTQADTRSLPGVEASDDREIIDGLTVADVRKMCERSNALASVLRATAGWLEIEKENPGRRTEDALRARLKKAALSDGWGSDSGQLAKNQQEDPLVKLITDGWRSGGRPKKE